MITGICHLLSNLFTARLRSVALPLISHPDRPHAQFTELLARIMGRLGFGTVRGSTTRGGAVALRAMREVALSGQFDLELPVVMSIMPPVQ